jgi:hypothetical protein
LFDTENFESKMYSRDVIQSYKSYIVGPPDFLLGMNIGIDNTELMPPFHPNFRNSDSIFIAVLKKCFLNSYIGHLPFAISHRPPMQRFTNKDDLTTPLVNISHFILSSIKEFKNVSYVPEEAIKALGIHLGQYSQLSDRSFSEYIHESHINQITNLIFYLDRLLKDKSHYNDQWTKIISIKIDSLYDILRQDSGSIEFKELSEITKNEQTAILKEIYKNFGKLLYHWPDIFTFLLNDKCYFI